MGSAAEILVLPFFGQGHLNPGAEICKHFSSHNCKSFLIIPSHLSSIPSDLHHHTSVEVVEIDSSPSPIPEIPDGDSSAKETPLVFKQQQQKLGHGIESFLAARFQNAQPAFVVMDVIMHRCKEIFKKAKIPIVSLFTTCACATAMEYAEWKFHVENIGPDEARLIPGFPESMALSYSDTKRLRRNDQGSSGGGRPPRTNQVPRWMDETEASVAVLINTCYDLEAPFLEYLMGKVGKPVFAVGPLLQEKFWNSVGSVVRDRDSRPNRKTNYTEDEVIEWLDLKPRRSVIYISFGSEVGPSMEEYEQLADDLAEMSKSFIWIKEEDDAKDDLRSHRKQMRYRKQNKEGELVVIDEESQMDLGMVPDNGSTEDVPKHQELQNATKSVVVISSSSESGSDVDANGKGRRNLLESEVETISVSDSDSDVDGNIDSSILRRRKKIRRILDDAELGEETQKKLAIEKERQERLRSLEVTESIMFEKGVAVEVEDNPSAGYIINLLREGDEEAVRIPPSISVNLKSHQISGIRFMWENIIQSVRKVKSGDKGLGCILAHTMGLGKTFQVIAFLYTAMRCVDLGLKTALIVTPVSVLHNWRHEFAKWRPSELKPLQIFMLQDATKERRLELLKKWKSEGGVFLIGYTAFRNLSLGTYTKDANVAREISHALQVGPDILVCDEGHIIKNTMSDTTRALKQVKCQRRIALTGSPLQNNLMEYYCMVDFVREGFLGCCNEFRNRFQNPIQNGQHTDATKEDVKIMNQRSHILYEQLKGFVHRMGAGIVKKDLPPKTVFVIAVKLSTLQRKLYKSYLDFHGLRKGRESSEKKSFFAGYQALAQILNHPGILQVGKENEDGSKSGAVEKCVAEEGSGDENIQPNQDWWRGLLQENAYKDVDYSGKMVLLLDILTICSDMGDKALVFSQSLSTLDLIEYYLSRLQSWTKGKDWYRFDGSVACLERQKLVDNFNDPQNGRVKCVLISTRAGSLGINLYSANRVIIVDGSWNPTYDLQAIYRVWRYGQTKPVYAYRLMAHATMEEKIYKRQVNKEGLAARVVDRQQVHRTVSREEMLDLFDFVDDESALVLHESGQEQVVEKQETTVSIGDMLKQRQLPSAGASSDKVLQTLISKHKPKWILSYHEHEALLQENEDERLSKEEQDMAWEAYQKSSKLEEAAQRLPPIDPLSYQHKISVDPSAPSQKLTSTAVSAVDPKPMLSSVKKPENHPPPQATTNVHKKCTKLSHLLTLRSQGTKVGCSTICEECGQEVSWDSVK